METLLLYLLKSALLLSLFWGVYVLFLRKETFFSLNRWFLLLGILTAIGLPMVQFEQLTFVKIQETLPASSHTLSVPSNASTPSNPWGVLFYVYLAGCTVTLVQLGLELLSLRRVIGRGRIIKQSRGVKFIEVNHHTSPFSFFNCIVYNPNLYNTSELESILIHEKVHVSQNHSIDILMGTFIKVVLWFNPISWLYKKELAQNLEYIADFESCSRTDQSKKEYQYLLLNQLGGVQSSVINPFYNSLIKSRIIMLQKSRSPRKRILKTLLVAPLIAGFMALFSFSERVEYMNDFPERPLETQDIEGLGSISLEHHQKTDVFTDFRAPATQDTIPLYIIDGSIKPADFNINTIDPNNIEKISVLKAESAVERYGERGQNGAVEITLKSNNNAIENALIIQDGTEMPADFDLNSIDENSIDSLHVYKGKKALEKFGKKGKEGVIVIKTKSDKK